MRLAFAFDLDPLLAEAAEGAFFGALLQAARPTASSTGNHQG